MKAIISSLAFLFLIGCGSGAEPTDDFQIDNPHDGIWQDALEVPFRFVLEQTFGVEEEPEEEMLAWISNLTTDDEGNVYMLDNTNGRIVSFDHDGQFRWSSGRHGGGPGEINVAYSLVWDGGEYLYLGNDRGNRIDRFDLDGLYVDSHMTSEFDLTSARLIGFVDSNTLLSVDIIGMLIATDLVFISVGEKWEIKVRSRIGEEVEEGQVTDAIPTSVGIFREEIVVGHTHDYRFRFYDTRMQLGRIVTREMDAFVPPGIDGGIIRVFTDLGLPIPLSSKYWLVRASWPTNVVEPNEYTRLAARQQADPLVQEITYDLFDNNWRLLYSWTEPEDDHPGPSRPIHVDSSGRIYARMQDGYPQIGRYRVEVTPPD